MPQLIAGKGWAKMFSYKDGTIKDERGRTVGTFKDGRFKDDRGRTMGEIRGDKVYDDGRAVLEVRNGRITKGGRTVGDVKDIKVKGGEFLSEEVLAGIQYFYSRGI